MAIRLRDDESVADGLRRIALAELDEARDRLETREPDETEAVVHDVRKRFKRLRALVRLARDGLGRDRADRENIRFRDAGRRLAGARDAAVLVSTFDALIATTGDPLGPEPLAAIRRALVERKQAVASRALGDREGLDAARTAVREAREAVEDWDFDAHGWRLLQGGIDRVYRRGHRAFREAKEDPADEALHDWRKRVKDLWTILEILRPVRSRYTEPTAERLHALADVVGDHHDLAVLKAVLLDPDEGIAPGIDLAPLIDRLDRRRDGLRDDALAMGEEVYRDTPDRFAARIRAYGRAWRAAIKASRFD